METYTNDYEEEWIAEAERRYALYKEGSMESRDITLVMSDAHQSLKCSADGADTR